MTNMNKELALEVWLNVEESAKYLSGLIDGIVQESNIYRYAWNNNLVLSLMFDSYQTASFGTFGQCSEGDLSIDNENICFKFDNFGTVRGTWDIVNKSKGKSCIYHLYRAKSDPSFSKPDFDIHSDRDNAIYLAAHDDSSCILELKANRSLNIAKDLPNDAVIVIKRDRLNELASSINDNFTDDNSTIHPVSHPLEAFHRMVDLSFKEVTFIIDPESTAVTVAARDTQKGVAYSDLGLTNKTNKVALNAQGKLFVSIITNGDTLKNNSTLTRLTQSLKSAFSIKESPFKDYSPIFKSRIPKDERAKKDALKRQTSYNDDLHSHNSEDIADIFLRDKNKNYDPEEFKI
jgi:hypothetical protein